MTSLVPSVQRPSWRCEETRRTAMAVLESPLVGGVHDVGGALVGATDIACSTSLSTERPSTSSFDMGCAEMATAIAAGIHDCAIACSIAHTGRKLCKIFQREWRSFCDAASRSKRTISVRLPSVKIRCCRQRGQIHHSLSGEGTCVYFRTSPGVLYHSPSATTELGRAPRTPSPTRKEKSSETNGHRRKEED